jgi:hypothetical protein
MGFDIHKIIGKYGCERVCKNPMARYVPLCRITQRSQAAVYLELFPFEVYFRMT